MLEEKERHHQLLKMLDAQTIAVLLFTSTIKLHRWIEVNPDPSGVIIDFKTTIYQDFLIRFSLRYPDIPVLSLKDQTEEQLGLRLRTFTNRLLKPNTNQCTGKILLVDDSNTVRVKYKKLLTKQGYSVDVAIEAKQGLDLALNNHYDLAIIDYFMPGDNGAQLCKNLQAHEKTYDLVCSILTSQYKQSVVDECLVSGASECMFKNESSDLFITRVKALLRGVERKRQVDKERARLIGLLYSVAEGVYGVSADGLIQFVNPATLKHLGLTMDELMGQLPHECIHPTDNRGQLTSSEHCFLQQAYVLGDELRDWRTLFRRADGSLFPIECSVTLLGNAEDVQGSVVVFRDISEQHRLEQHWKWQLNHDQLTGSLNRDAFEEVLGRELNRVKRSKKNALLLFVDLDRFKLINDELGHAAGDQLLINLAQELQNQSRNIDYVGRLSGDEFVILITNAAVNKFEFLAEKYRVILENTSLFWEDKIYTVTGSIGLTILDSKSVSIGELLNQADQACQQAKRKGRNQWSFYSKQDAQLVPQGNWLVRLKTAIQNEQFILLQHPIYQTENANRRVGTSCLLRLKEGGSLISPATFMSDAKRFGVIKDIDILVVKKLIEHFDSNLVMQEGWFSLSLSIEAISDERFRQELFDLLDKSNLSARQLRFEIGEEELYKFPNWKKHLSDLRSQGFGIIISHFGKSIQSILNMAQMPIDAIKLDTSITQSLITSIPCRNLIDAIVKTANQSNIDIIASHVETSTDLELLGACDIYQMQGFYFGKPEQI